MGVKPEKISGDRTLSGGKQLASLGSGQGSGRAAPTIILTRRSLSPRLDLCFTAPGFTAIATILPRTKARKVAVPA